MRMRREISNTARYIIICIIHSKFVYFPEVKLNFPLLFMITKNLPLTDLGKKSIHFRVHQAQWRWNYLVTRTLPECILKAITRPKPLPLELHTIKGAELDPPPLPLPLELHTMTGPIPVTAKSTEDKRLRTCKPRFLLLG